MIAAAHHGTHANLPKGGIVKDNSNAQLDNRKAQSGNLSNFLHNKTKQANEPYLQSTLMSSRQQIGNNIGTAGNSSGRQNLSTQQYDKNYKLQNNQIAN